MTIDKAKVLEWVERRLVNCENGADWDAEDFIAGQYSAYREMQDLLEDGFFEPMTGVRND